MPRRRETEVAAAPMMAEEKTLPATASLLPLMALFGLLALGGALALRVAGVRSPVLPLEMSRGARPPRAPRQAARNRAVMQLHDAGESYATSSVSSRTVRGATDFGQ